jgi:putative intracellular protease/amidase
MARVLIPLPARDFDPSEAAVSWRVLSRAGHTVSFATPEGRPALADDMMLTGKGLDLWAGRRAHIREDFCGFAEIAVLSQRSGAVTRKFAL